jgi:hypothetical protein
MRIHLLAQFVREKIESSKKMCDWALKVCHKQLLDIDSINIDLTRFDQLEKVVLDKTSQMARLKSLSNFYRQHYNTTAMLLIFDFT